MSRSPAPRARKNPRNTARVFVGFLRARCLALGSCARSGLLGRTPNFGAKMIPGAEQTDPPSKPTAGSTRSVGPGMLASGLTSRTDPLAINLLGCLTEPPFSALVMRQCGDELGFAEIRPKGRCHEKLRVGNLPEQEVRDAHFAAGTNQQV